LQAGTLSPGLAGGGRQAEGIDLQLPETGRPLSLAERPGFDYTIAKEYDHQAQ
jgi:hypothetical protein